MWLQGNHLVRQMMVFYLFPTTPTPTAKASADRIVSVLDERRECLAWLQRGPAA